MGGYLIVETLTPINALQASMIIIEVTLLILVILITQISRAIADKTKHNEDTISNSIPKFTYNTLKITKEVQNNDKETESTSTIDVNVDTNGNITSKTTSRVPKS